MPKVGPSDQRIAEVAKEAASGTPPAASPADRKLDAKLESALEKHLTPPAAGELPKLDPDVPIQDGNGALVDISAKVTSALLDEIARQGGTVVSSDESSGAIRAMVPFSQMRTLAERPDVTSIVPGTLTITSGAKQ